MFGTIEITRTKVDVAINKSNTLCCTGCLSKVICKQIVKILHLLNTPVDLKLMLV